MSSSQQLLRISEHLESISESLKQSLPNEDITLASTMAAACNIAHDRAQKAEARVLELEDYMRQAGLAAFIKDKPPETIASHLQDVIQSYMDRVLELEDCMRQAVIGAPIANEISGPNKTVTFHLRDAIQSYTDRITELQKYKSAIDSIVDRLDINAKSPESVANGVHQLVFRLRRRAQEAESK